VELDAHRQPSPAGRLGESPELPGYTVEKVGDGSGGCAYHLTGRRGASYSLFRNVNKPHLLFAVNGRGAPCRVRGSEWFSDESGALRPVKLT
jgi:hypothetical protein